MNTKLIEMLSKARTYGMSLPQREKQRRSFAFGSANIENEQVTRDTVRSAEENLLRQKEAIKNGR
jgi:hypothetical protein